MLSHVVVMLYQVPLFEPLLYHYGISAGELRSVRRFCGRNESMADKVDRKMVKWGFSRWLTTAPRLSGAAKCKNGEYGLHGLKKF